MKINWGTGIAIFYTGFVVVMIAMVVQSSKKDLNMVQENYYDKDLNYEAFRQSRINGTAMEKSIRIDYNTGKNITITFPPGLSIDRGLITLYRPSDQHLDRKYEIKLDENNQMQITTTSLLRGSWRILLDWENDGRSFYHEKNIVL